MAIILIVEDSPDSAEPIATLLARKGHRTNCQPDGREALAALVADPPDLIILDLRMPRMDGVTFLQVLRSYLRWDKLPVIVVTALPADGPEVTRAVQLGARRVFLKTRLDLNELVEYVDRTARSPEIRNGLP
ncbi:MAG: response regulator [Tepidisphaeraceae bacterium]